MTLALQACKECGHQVSDRAAACPGCGAPVSSQGVPALKPTLEDWALLRLRMGSSRRQVVEELVQQGSLTTPDAEELVKSVESAALGPQSGFLTSTDRGRLIQTAMIGSFAVFIVMLFLFFAS